MTARSKQRCVAVTIAIRHTQHEHPNREYRGWMIDNIESISRIASVPNRQPPKLGYREFDLNTTPPVHPNSEAAPATTIQQTTRQEPLLPPSHRPSRKRVLGIILPVIWARLLEATPLRNVKKQSRSIIHDHFQSQRQCRYLRRPVPAVRSERRYKRLDRLPGWDEYCDGQRALVANALPEKTEVEVRSGIGRDGDDST
ncbi:hypothetical protein G7046_g9885 [Stylonectria norvegica]|nr:hypothetical protein G7046_g9885 [Stylonectria norvegica]